MAEGYNCQFLTGIVKVIRPNGKPVLGIADGQGQFMWLPTEKIIMSHPMQFENWQTTIFAIVADWKITWKAEQKWDDFKGSYPTNTKPILQPIPDMFKGAQTTYPVQQQPQQPPTPMTAQPSVIQQGSNIGIQQPAEARIPAAGFGTIQTTTQKLMNETLYGLKVEDPIVQPLKHIAVELTNIRKLLELYIKPPELKTAEDLLITEEQVADQYGTPPEEKVDKPNVNKGVLPNIFGD